MPSEIEPVQLYKSPPHFAVAPAMICGIGALVPGILLAREIIEGTVKGPPAGAALVAALFLLVSAFSLHLCITRWLKPLNAGSAIDTDARALCWWHGSGAEPSVHRIPAEQIRFIRITSTEGTDDIALYDAAGAKIKIHHEAVSPNRLEWSHRVQGHFPHIAVQRKGFIGYKDA